MEIVQVIPLSRGVFRDTLSYFSAESLKTGAIVNITIKNKKINALVINSQPAKQLKTSLKTSAYSLKKISGVITKRFLLPKFIEATIKTANYHATRLGPCLKNLISKNILEQAQLLKLEESNKNNASQNNESEGPNLAINRLALQDNEEERLSFYKSLIREEFAKGFSVFICQPTVIDVEETTKNLERGINNYIFAFHGQLAKKVVLERWQQASTLEHPVVIVGTPPFLSLPRADIKTIITDHQSSNAYKGLTRPFINYHVFIDYLCQAYGATSIRADTCLSAEMIQQLKIGYYHPARPLKRTTNAISLTTLLRVKSGELWSTEITEWLNQAVSHQEQTFILANRRGLSPTIVCNDCGTLVRCQGCQAPITLHGGATFLCHRCGERRNAKENCLNCQSWHLQALGAGTEKVVTEIKKLFPSINVLRLDSDVAKTAKQATNIITKFHKHPGSVLVGTEMAYHYLRTKVDNIFVVAIDSLLSLPDFGIHEQLFQLLINLRTMASRHFIVQTRYEDEPFFRQAIKGNLNSFYTDELSHRSNFGYPPFKLLVKISREGVRGVVQEEMRVLAKTLEMYKPIVYQSLQSEKSKQYRLNLLLKQDPEKWPESDLIQILKSLPPAFTININPNSIL